MEEVSRESSNIGHGEWVLLGSGGEGGAVNLGGWGSGSLLDPLDNGIGSSATRVIRLVSVVKPVKSWEALDTESISKFFLFSCIDFSDIHWWV
jgi:hypothetical protein